MHLGWHEPRITAGALSHYLHANPARGLSIGTYAPSLSQLEAYFS